MLRGALEQVSAGRVSGWIYSERWDVRGCTVLAFIEDRCVGAGSLDQPRPDLSAAGLASGDWGFDFAIDVPNSSEQGRTVVRLENSDFTLLPAQARIASFADQPAGLDRVAESLEWMRGRGWLEPREVDLVKGLSRFGVYDMALAPLTAIGTGRPIQAPNEAAAEVFSLLSQNAVLPTTLRWDRHSLPHDLRVHLLGAFREPIGAFWSCVPLSLLVVEGSAADPPLSMAGAVEYILGPNRLVFVDLRGAYQLGDAPSGELKVLGLPLKAAVSSSSPEAGRSG